MGVYGDTMAVLFDMYASANGGDDGRYLRCYDLVTGDAITPSSGTFQLVRRLCSGAVQQRCWGGPLSLPSAAVAPLPCSRHGTRPAPQAEGQRGCYA